MKTLLTIAALLSMGILASGCGEEYPQDGPLKLLSPEDLAKVSIPSGDIRWGKTLVLDDERALADILILNESSQKVGWAEIQMRVVRGGTLIANETIHWRAYDSIRNGQSATDDVWVGLPRSLVQLHWKRHEASRRHHLGLWVEEEQEDGPWLLATFSLKRAANRQPAPGEEARTTTAAATAAPKAQFPTCTGAADCRACTNCSRCRHCARDGGTCGVCSD